MRPALRKKGTINFGEDDNQNRLSFHYNNSNLFLQNTSTCTCISIILAQNKID